MKRLLSNCLTAALTLTVALSASATPERKAPGRFQAGPQLDAPVTARPKGKGIDEMPKTKTRGVRNLTRVATQTPLTPNYAKTPRQQEAVAGAFYGAMVYSDAWGYNADFCIVSIPTGGGEYTRVADMQGTTTSWYADGKYYAYAVEAAWGFYYGTTVDVYDATTWALESSTKVDVPNMKLLDFKQNPADGTVYGSASDGSQLMWGTIDLNTFEFTPIQEGMTWGAFGLIIKDGKGYGINAKGHLLEIELETGNSTLIGQTNIATQYITSAHYDEATGRMLYVKTTDTACELYSVDLATAEVQKLHSYPDCEIFTGFFAPRNQAQGTPAAVSGLSIATDGPSLEYTVNFTAPANDVQGNALSGELSYKVFTAGQVLTGTVAPGANVSVSAATDYPGMCSARVTVSNAAGESFGAGCAAYVGPDDITELTNVVLRDNGNGTFTLSWDTPKPVHNGYFDPAQVTYQITDAQGNTVAEDVTGTSYVIAYTEPQALTTFQYSVAPTYLGVTYNPVASNGINKGSMEPPFSCTFDTAEDLAQFTIINANNDPYTWTYRADKQSVRVSHNSNMDMDDWLILPPMRFEAGKSYTFALDAACADESCVERFEVKLGTAATVEAMTATVIPATEVGSRAYQTYSNKFSVPATGVYCLGIHGCSDFDKYYLYVDNIAVSGPAAGTTPAAVTDLTAVAGANGARTATISFTTPTLTMGGQPVGNLTNVTVSRADGSVVTSINRPEAGKAYTVEDTDPAMGSNTYSVVVSNADGASDAATVTVFVGYATPAEVTSLVATEEAEGTVVLFWDPVTVDVNGTQLPAGNVTYNVYVTAPDGRVLIAESLTEPTLTYVATEPGSQALVQHVVTAANEAGESEGALSGMICVGTPFETPFVESFAEQSLHYPWSLANPNPDGPMDVMMGGESTLQGIGSQDADGGYVIFKGQYADDAVAMYSGKIAIPAQGKTVLTYYTLGLSTEKGNQIRAEVICDGVRTELGTVTPLADMEWVRVAYDLTPYAGRNIRLVLTCTVTAYAYVMLDNISIASPLDSDLSLLSFDAPAKVDAGQDITLTATVENQGANPADTYTVDFYMNGQLLTSVPGNSVGSLERTQVTATVATTPLTADALQFSAAVNFAADQNPANNESKTLTTDVVKTNMRVPAGLTASLVDNDVVLGWEANPAIDFVGRYMTENFEGAVAGTSQVEGWTMVDMDHGPAGSINNKVVPGLPAGEPASFVVFEKGGVFTSATFNAFSGSQYLISMYNSDGSASSDWAISPVLSGNAQTVSFWAKSYSKSYAEQVRVHYTVAESVDPADYVAVADFGTKTVPNEWTLYSFQLPAGATHFAIESCATNAFFLMVDDVTFEVGGNQVNLQGYNVYVDGAKHNTELVAANGYTHVAPAEGEHVYNVTAVYDQGESRPSAEARIQYNGLDKLTAGVNVVAVGNEIVITGAAGADIAVVTADGRQVASRQGVDATRIKVLGGIYLVNVGPRTVKVAVK